MRKAKLYIKVSIVLLTILVFFEVGIFSSYATSDSCLRPRAFDERPLHNQDEYREVIDIFNKFDADFVAKPEGCTVERVYSGWINPGTYILQDKKTGKKYVVQRLSNIFDVEAIDNNIQLLEKAQVEARRQGILSKEWLDVHYLWVKDSQTKIYRDSKGQVWRIMDFVEGEIFISFNDIPQDDRIDAAFSQGRAIATFGAVLRTIPERQWRYPLPGFHNHIYHFEYLKSILENRKVRLSLSQAKPPPMVQLDWSAISTYENGIDRINALIEKLNRRRYLLHSLDHLDKGIMHNDTRLDNFVFRRDTDTGKLY